MWWPKKCQRVTVATFGFSMIDHFPNAVQPPTSSASVQKNPSRSGIAARAALVALIGSLALSCSRQVVLMQPKEDDLVVLNGCVISACNYLALVEAQHKLEKDFWSRILLVRYANHPAGHAYCIWETAGTIYGYSRNSGSFPIPVQTKDAKEIATILAVDLSKALHQTLAVSTAQFVEPEQSRLTEF